jgi:hypothetical protein
MTATKSDIAELTSSLIRWNVASQIAFTIICAAIVKVC